MTERIELADGKYTILRDDEWLVFLRHGEPWPQADRDLRHVNVVRELVDAYLELRQQLAVQQPVVDKAIERYTYLQRVRDTNNPQRDVDSDVLVGLTIELMQCVERLVTPPASRDS